MRILLLTPFRAERIALEKLLRDEGHEVTSMASRSDAVEWVMAHRPDVVIADAQVPGLDGLALVCDMSNHGPVEVILLCPRSNRAVDPAGVACLTKPIDLDELIQQLERGSPTEARVA